MTAGEIAEQECLPGLRGPQDGQDFGGGSGVGGLPNALAPHSTTTAPHKTTPALALGTAQGGPLEAPHAELGHPRARMAASASEPTEQDYSSSLAGPRDGQPFEFCFSGLDAGGLLDDFDTPSTAASTSGKRFRSAASTALEVASTSSSAAAAPRSVDGVFDSSMEPVFLASFRVDTEFHRDSSTDTFQGGNAAQTACRPRMVATIIHIYFNTMRVRRLANHLLVLAQPGLRAQTIYASLLHVVLGASHATPQSLLNRRRPI